MGIQKNIDPLIMQEVQKGNTTTTTTNKQRNKREHQVLQDRPEYITLTTKTSGLQNHTLLPSLYQKQQ